MSEASLSLAQARLAKGISLEDAERGTRISKRFLIALEARDYSVFPAPVYARGFLRTYCRYLGLDPEPELSALPLAWDQEPAIPARPSMPGQLRPLWLAGGLLGAFLVFVLTVLGAGGDLSALTGGQAREEQAPGADTAFPPGGRPVPVSPPGVLPDLVGVSVGDAQAFLQSRGLTFLVVYASVERVADGLVVGQFPAAGSNVQPGSAVTLTVSSAAAEDAPMRTSCSALGATNQRTQDEQQWFEDNCRGAAPASQDRTDCEEIRGTAYRSERERAFFLANCIVR